MQIILKKNVFPGRRNDICQRTPCLHQGVCSQIIQEPGFRCRCEGTGYYGTRCQHGKVLWNLFPLIK